jgi:hypothetical protein
MRTLFPLIVLVLLAPALLAQSAKSVVRFSNGDQLSGTLESLDTSRLLWNSPILEKPTPFFLRSVLDLTLAASHPENPAKHEATLSLTNGDTVRGQLAGVSDDAIEIDTWFAGRMKFRRVMVSAIRIDERPVLTYQGPDGIEEWKQNEDPPAWTYRDSSFRSNAAGGIGRELDLPDECSIAFDAAWRGQFSLKVSLFSDDVSKDNPSNGYMMTFQQRSIFVQNSGNQMSLGRSTNAFALQENEKARIEIRASLKTGKICVFVDGKIIEVWTDPNFAQTKHERGLHFAAMNTSPLRISRIAVGPWDGVIDQMPEPAAAGGFRQFGIQEMMDEPQAAPPEKLEKGRMLLRNGDSIAGEVLAIEKDLITIKTPFKDVRLPVEMLKSVALKTVDLERCKRENGDVRGWFPDGSSIVFRLEGVGEGTLKGTNQNFGAAEFKIAAFNRIEFNIYDPKFEALRDASGW